MKVEIDITDPERAALERMYRMTGLAHEIPGNRPTFLEMVIKKLVEALKAKEQQ